MGMVRVVLSVFRRRRPVVVALAPLVAVIGDFQADSVGIVEECGEVVLGAVYLFQTYWIGMRNIMYANR